MQVLPTSDRRPSLSVLLQARPGFRTEPSCRVGEDRTGGALPADTQPAQRFRHDSAAHRTARHVGSCRTRRRAGGASPGNSHEWEERAAGVSVDGLAAVRPERAITGDGDALPVNRSRRGSPAHPRDFCGLAIACVRLRNCRNLRGLFNSCLSGGNLARRYYRDAGLHRLVQKSKVDYLRVLPRAARTLSPSITGPMARNV